MVLLRGLLPLSIAILVVVFEVVIEPWVHLEISPLLHYGSEVALYGIVGPIVTFLTLDWVARGLAEKERAEALARERERFLASITAASAEAIISLDERWTVRTWNRGAHMIFGHGQEMVGRPFERLLPPEAQPGELEDIRVSLSEQGFVLDHETTLLHRTGARVPVELTATALTDERGSTLGHSLVLRDISLRKRQEKLVVEERKRIAGEIHDAFAQDLYSTTLKLDLCLKLLETGQSARLAEELALIKSVLQRGMHDVRRTIFALQPIELEELGFQPAVKRLAETFQHLHGGRATLTVDGPQPTLPKRLEVFLFRALQELLNNVAKHAQAHCVGIRLLAAPEEVELVVEDDGRGFDPTTLAGQVGHLGLAHLKEQAERQGGRLTLTSAPGQGTVVRLGLPVRGLVRS